MTTLRKVLPFTLLALVAVWTFTGHHSPTLSQVVYAQTACSFTYTFTGNATQTGVPNLSGNTPCVNWRITLSTTGSLSSTVTFNTSPDNSTWTAVPNTVCSSTVQPPCVLQGTNPIVGNQGMLYAAAYGNYVQVVVSASSGTGKGTIRGYGAFGATAAGPSVGGGGGGGGTIATTTKPLKGDNAGNAVASAAADTVGLFSACSGIEYLGADGACHAAPSAPTAVAAMSNLTPVTVSANTTADQTLQEVPLTAGALNTLLAANLIHGSGYFTIAALQTPTLRFKAKLCTVSGCASGTVVTLASITSGATVAATNNGWNLQLMAGTSATGATGTLTVHGAPGLVLDLGALTGTAATPYTDLNTGVSSTIDLTAALFLDFTVATSAGNAGNSFTENIAEVLPQGAGGGGGDTFTPPYVTPDSISFYGPIFAVSKPPAISSLSWANQGAASATNENGAILMAAPTNSGDDLRALLTAYPGSPFTFTVGMIQNSIGTSASGSSYELAGIVTSDGTKFASYGTIVGQGIPLSAVYQGWTNTSTCCTGQVIPFPLLNAGPIYLTITDDGTNITFWISSDPLDLKRLQVNQQSRTTFLTPTQIGVFVDCNSTSYPLSALFFHWAGI
jgi:hypothetical protein